MTKEISDAYNVYKKLDSSPCSQKQVLSDVASIQSQTNAWLPELLEENGYPTPKCINWESRYRSAHSASVDAAHLKLSCLKLSWCFGQMLTPTNPLYKDSGRYGLISGSVSITIFSDRSIYLYGKCRCSGEQYILFNDIVLCSITETYFIPQNSNPETKFKA